MPRIGYKHSKEVRQKLSKAQKIRFSKTAPWNKGLKGVTKAWNKGVNVRLNPKGEFKKGHHTWNKGKKMLPMTLEQRQKISRTMNGKRSELWNWKGGITPLTKLIRSSFKYRQWISDVFTRDNYTCVWCGQRGGKLNADHIKPFSYIFHDNQIKTLEEAINCEEFWNINNGRTLCFNCHTQTETFAGKIFNRIEK